MGDVTQFPPKSGPGIGHRPRKNATAVTAVRVTEFKADDEVRNLRALKNRLSEMLAKPTISERDFATINKDYRKVMVELKDAQERAAASKLGRRIGVRAVGARTFDGDI